MEPSGCILLWGRGQRYVLTELLFDHGPLRVAEIVALLHAQGLVVGGRPSKTVSDALRWEVAHGRVVRLDRGLYGPGRMPRSTRAWIRRRNRLLRSQGECPVGRPVAVNSAYDTVADTVAPVSGAGPSTSCANNRVRNGRFPHLGQDRIAAACTQLGLSRGVCVGLRGGRGTRHSTHHAPRRVSGGASVC